MTHPVTFKEYLTIHETLTEEQLNEVNWKALAAGGALAAGLAAGRWSSCTRQYTTNNWWPYNIIIYFKWSKFA